ncbi:MAG: DUF6434 domain-containing protein [Pseudomonadota bacterium]
MDDERPSIGAITSGAELRNWYWLKEELLQHAKALGLATGGSKSELTERIATYLDTGKKLAAPRTRSASRFDWSKEKLSKSTIITDSYRNGPNVRAFFKQHDGPDFTFNIAFMKWMKDNTGKTLGDAIKARRAIAEHEKVHKPAIPAGNQYNAYTRAFFEANPDLSVKDARACWAWKRSRPGHNRYEDADLIALGQTEIE